MFIIKRLAENMRSMTIVFIAVACLLAGGADAQQLVREFKGDKSSTTDTFTVDGPWLLDWRLDVDYEQLTALDIALIDANTGRHLGRVLYTKRRGNGLKLFDEGGSFKLRISSTLARWTVKISQIAPEDRERYTPRKEDPLKPSY
jgi:hypothetical protein